MYASDLHSARECTVMIIINNIQGSFSHCNINKTSKSQFYYPSSVFSTCNKGFLPWATCYVMIWQFREKASQRAQNIGLKAALCPWLVSVEVRGSLFLALWNWILSSGKLLSYIDPKLLYWPAYYFVSKHLVWVFVSVCTKWLKKGRDYNTTWQWEIVWGDNGPVYKDLDQKELKVAFPNTKNTDTPHTSTVSV